VKAYDESNPPSTNGIGEAWDLKKPFIRGIDLTKPDQRIKVPRRHMEGTDPSSKILFTNVQILDSTGRQPFSGSVLVEGERIRSVGVVDGVESQGARIVDGKGRTLMSGLVDAHTHFTWTNAGNLDALATMGLEEHTLFSARSARTFLDCGYTMCFGAASAKQRIDTVLRNAIYDNEIPGPRFLANGMEMAPREGALVAGITAYADTPEEVLEKIALHIETDVDNVKLSMSGEEITETLRAEDTVFPDEHVRIAVEAAHAAGKRVCGHARSDESIMQCLQYGVDVIYHASFISDLTMDALEAQKDRVYVAPAINWIVATINDAAAFGYTPTKAESVGYKRELEVACAGLREMRRRGIKVLPGGDYGFAWCPHGTQRDLEHFVNLMGYSPMEAIIAATALGGELMGQPDELGKILPGYYADLLLVDGNPLEDITLLSKHGKHLDMVLINGRIHKQLRKDMTSFPDIYEETALPTHSGVIHADSKV
jgi:imidazolonepropionase-like amidohydrolase